MIFIKVDVSSYMAFEGEWMHEYEDRRSLHRQELEERFTAPLLTLWRITA